MGKSILYSLPTVADIRKFTIILDVSVTTKYKVIKADKIAQNTNDLNAISIPFGRVSKYTKMKYNK